jgi:hypothetical protein
MIRTSAEQLSSSDSEGLFSSEAEQPAYYPPNFLKQVEADQLAFERDEQTLYQAASEDELDKSEIQQQLQALRERFASLVNRYKSRVKLVVTESLASALIFGAAVGIESAPAYAQAPERPRRVTAASELESYRPYTEQEIRKQLLEDENERLFLRTNLDDSGVQFEFSSGESSFLRFSSDDYFDKFLESRKRQATSLEVNHTHPKGSYVVLLKRLNYSPTQINQFISGEKPWPPMPPSTSDFISQFKFQQHYAEKKISVTGRVFEPTGIWLYEVDQDNKFMKSIMEMQEAYFNQLNKKLTEQEWGIMQSMVFSGDQDPRAVMDDMRNASPKQDPSGAQRRLGNKLAKINAQIDKRFGSVLAVINSLDKAGLKVVTAQTDIDRAEATHDYVRLCAQNSIHLTRLSQ